MLKRTFALLLVGGLVSVARAQTVPIETGMPGGPASPLSGLEIPGANVPGAGWREGLDQIVSFEGLAASAALQAPDAPAASAAALPRSLKAAAPATRGLERPGRAARSAVPAALPAARETGAEKASGASAADFASGSTLAESLGNFGGAWNASGRSLNAASDDGMSARGYQDFSKLLGAKAAAPSLSDGPVETLQASPELPASEARTPPVEEKLAAAPKIKIPFGASARYHASYLGSWAAAALGVAAVTAPFFAAGPAGLLAFAPLLVHHVYRETKHSVEFQASGAKEVYTRADLEALLADPKNAAHAPALRNVIEGLDSAAQLGAYVGKRTGADVPMLGWFKPVPYNLSSWGFDAAAGWVALGETVLTRYIQKDWKIVAGAIAHEMGHLHFGDWRKYIMLEKVTQALYSMTGASGTVRKMTGQRVLTGDKPLSDKWSLGALGAVLLTAAKAVGLLKIGWPVLLAFPAAFALMLLSALLKQAYMRAQEFRADQYSAAATHPSWMIGYLMELRAIHVGDGSKWWQRILSSHPATEERIRRLDSHFKPSEQPRSAAPAQTARYKEAGEELAWLAKMYEAGRVSLEQELKSVASKVELVYDLEEDGFTFAATLLKPGAALPAFHLELPVVEAGKLADAVPAAEYFTDFRGRLEAARSELEKKLVPAAATSVRAVYDGQGFLLAVTVTDPSPAALAKLPKTSGEFPVQPFKPE